MILRRVEAYTKDPDHDWDTVTRWERHAISAVLDLIATENALVDATMRAEAAEGKLRWIPTGERLPNPQDTVLIFQTVTNSVVSARWTWALYWLGEDDVQFQRLQVTHWMPLPEKPEGKP